MYDEDSRCTGCIDDTDYGDRGDQFVTKENADDGSDSYWFRFIDIPSDYDEPSSDLLYKIRNSDSSSSYLTCNNAVCNTENH